MSKNHIEFGKWKLLFWRNSECETEFAWKLFKSGIFSLFQLLVWFLSRKIWKNFTKLGNLLNTIFEFLHGRKSRCWLSKNLSENFLKYIFLMILVFSFFFLSWRKLKNWLNLNLIFKFFYGGKSCWLSFFKNVLQYVYIEAVNIFFLYIKRF